MRTKINYAMLLTVFVWMSGCNHSPTENSAVNMKTSKKDSTFNICYSSIVKKDTVLLNALMSGDSITGSLGYKLYEKDQNNGSIIGKMSGDTIRARYTFMSEGKESIREVAFLRKDTLLIEGLGNLKEENGQVIFENIKDIKFNGLVLSKVSCK